MKDAAAPAPVELLVCVTCRMGRPVEDDAARPGALLHAAIAERDLPEGVTLKPVECFSNCDLGCSVAFRGGPDRWTYVYGNFDPSDVEASHADVIAEGVARYHATADGLVPWRERPQHLRKNCIARIPPVNAPETPPED